MRYLLIFLAYFAISFVLLLGILFPKHLSSPLDFLLLTLYFVPCIGTFDVLGQRLMDNNKFANLSHLTKLAVGIISVVMFIFALQMLIDVVGMETEPWW